MVTAFTEQFRWRNWVRAALIVLCIASTANCTRPDPTLPDTSSIDFRGDFETVDERQFNALECPNPGRQFKIVTDPVRQGDYAARFEVAPGDTWSNGSIRCLVANYGTNEREGEEYFYAYSMYFPQKPTDTIIWELHHREELYSVAPDTSVPPHAVIVSGGALKYRLLTGPAVWDGSAWTGWSEYQPDIPIVGSIPVGQWIDIAIHIRFTHADQGVLEVWHRTGDEAWTPQPQLTRRDIPTLQWIPGYENQVLGRRNDPNLLTDIRTSSLYTELGLYPGTDSITTTDVVYLDGYRRGKTAAAVMAEFP